MVPTAGPSAPLLPPLVEPTTSLQEAVEGGTLGLGFAAAGFLVFYMLGVNLALTRLGVITPGRVRTAGASVGSLVQGINYPGMGDHDEFLGHGLRFIARCRQEEMRGCFGRLDQEYAALLEQVLKPNVSEAITGRACMVVSRGTTAHPVGEAACEFGSRQQVMNALRASAFVPGVSAQDPTIPFKGAPAFDGIFSQMLPCPAGVTYCIKVSALPPMRAATIARNLLSPRDLWATVNAAASAARGWLGPEPGAALADAYRRDTVSQVDAAAWVKVLSKHSKAAADVYPGRWRRSALSPLQWLVYLLTPPDEATVRLMYQEGQADGEAWARAQGWHVSSLE